MSDSMHDLENTLRIEMPTEKATSPSIYFKGESNLLLLLLLLLKKCIKS